MKYMTEWAADPNNPNIFYHDEIQVRGSFQTPTVATGGSDPTTGKGKARVTSTSSGEAPSSATPSTGIGDYAFIGQLKPGWTFYEHKVNGQTIKLWKSEWKYVGAYYYHHGQRLQGKEP